MNHHILLKNPLALLVCLVLSLICRNSIAEIPAQPNLVIIMTDEHNLRTLGCYRRQMTSEQAHVWGPGVRVDTPQIDSIAKQGAICTNYYASSPVCTPSRASFVSGLYPQATGSPSNNLPMNDDVVTFAEILRRNGYSTSYVGKWHLDGDAKPGWAPKRKFGFTDNQLMFNRGHWKKFRSTDDGAEIIGSYNPETGKSKYSIADATQESFSTDFLTDRTLDIIRRDQNKPFCVMLSLPDPHGPNTVREPYDLMFQNFVFEKPASMSAALSNPDSVPKWNKITGKNTAKDIVQDQMSKYFGMVKCIDDNVGKILEYLQTAGLSENTIVVFTSDHGDMMCEHCRMNKGLPYETSAKIPFVIRYPARIQPGKIIQTAQTNVDFTPTVLGLMDIKHDLPEFHGKNTAADFLSDETRIVNDRIVYLRNSGGAWVAAVDHHYKLVLSTSDTPWLFDLEKDPNELTNCFEDPEYREIGSRLKNQLLELMKQYHEPALAKLMTNVSNE